MQIRASTRDANRAWGISALGLATVFVAIVTCGPADNSMSGLVVRFHVIDVRDPPGAAGNVVEVLYFTVVRFEHCCE